MIPFFTERFETQMSNFKVAEDGVDNAALRLSDLKKFYCDTATFGYQPSNVKACVDFFLPGRVLFGTDTPMDMARPGYFNSTAVSTVESLSDARACGVGGKEAIFWDNAMNMLGDKVRQRLESGEFHNGDRAGASNLLKVRSKL